MRTNETLRRSTNRITGSIQELESLAQPDAEGADPDAIAIARTAQRLSAFLFELAATTPESSGLATFRHAAAAAVLDPSCAVRLGECLSSDDLEAVAEVLTETAAGCRSISRSQPAVPLELSRSERADLLLPSLADQLLLAAQRATALELSSPDPAGPATAAGEVLAALESIRLAVGDGPGLVASTAARLVARQGGHLHRALLAEAAVLLEATAARLIDDAGIRLPDHSTRPQPAVEVGVQPDRRLSLADFERLTEISTLTAGTIYSGIHPGLGLPTAIYAFDRNRTGRAALERLVATRETIGGLAHPGIVQPFEIQTETDPILVVTELVEGRSLHRVLAEEGALPEPAAVDRFRQLLSAVGAIHAAGLVHGGLTLGSVLVSAAGRVRVAGLGLCGLAFPLTAEDVAVDVAALGRLFHDLLAGREPAFGRSHDSAAIPTALMAVINLATGVDERLEPIGCDDLYRALAQAAGPEASGDGDEASLNPLVDLNRLPDPPAGR